MPAISSGKVLVTGANGFIAVWVIKDLLEHEFSVRGTVRSESKAGHLRDLFKSHGNKFEVVIIGDMTQDGAFDTAIEGVDAIMHLASPVILDCKGPPDEIIVPTVNGAKSILTSALKAPFRTTIKRVLYLSSAAAIWEPPPSAQAGYVRAFDENDWNGYSIEQARTRGAATNGFDKYRAAKTLAERALWEIFQRERSKGEEKLGWDLVALHPPRVYGPILHEAPTLESIGVVPKEWVDHVVKGDLQGDALTKDGYDFVDVRDLARAHVLSITVPEAGGERFIIRGHEYVWQQFVDAARRYSDRIPVGKPSYKLEDAIYSARYNSAKSQKVLGITYRPLEETARDIVEDLHRRRWL